MKLNIDFSELNKSVEKMGATKIEFHLDTVSSSIDPIDTELKIGISISANDIEYNKSGVLTYKRRHVLLYIEDHGKSINSALKNPNVGKKYHIAYCPTLENMKKSGRFERYIVKNDVSGDFSISGYDPTTKEKKEGIAKLKVCKNCLRFLNYEGYNEKATNAESYAIATHFSLKEFFKKNKVHFK